MEYDSLYIKNKEETIRELLKSNNINPSQLNFETWQRWETEVMSPLVENFIVDKIKFIDMINSSKRLNYDLIGRGDYIYTQIHEYLLFQWTYEESKLVKSNLGNDVEDDLANLLVKLKLKIQGDQKKEALIYDISKTMAIKYYDIVIDVLRRVYK